MAGKDEGKLERDQDKLLSAAQGLLETIAKLRRMLSIAEAPLLFYLVIVVWVAASDSVAFGRASPIWFGVAYTILQVFLVKRFCCTSIAEKMHFSRSRVLIVGGLLYLLLSEYVLRTDHLASPARNGILFQHMPTYLALMAANNLTEAAIALGVFAVLVLPLADNWWRINNFVIHCCLICFAAWVKTKLLDLVKQCEALLEVRGVMLEVTMSKQEEDMKHFDRRLKTREASNSDLTQQLTKLKQEYNEMSDVAEQAVAMMNVSTQWKKP